LPYLSCVVIEQVLRAGKSVRIQAKTDDRAVACPERGVGSRRVHSRYVRRLSDVPVVDQETNFQPLQSQQASGRSFRSPDWTCRHAL
jgi:hypothetical protein